MFEKYLQLCKENGVTSYKVAKDTGISQVALSDWKSGRTKTPSVGLLKKLADYFNVSIDYFVSY